MCISLSWLLPSSQLTFIWGVQWQVMLKSMYMSIGIPPELRKALMELELELTRCGVPLVGIIAAPDAVSGANVLVVVRGRAEEWVEKVAEAKLKVDRRLGDTGILPAVVSESSRKVEAFRLAGAARVAGDVDVSQEGAEPHEAG